MDRRINKRFDANLPIILPTGKAQTQNISAGGVYFELETSDAEQYSVGQNIPIWLHTSFGSDNSNSTKHVWLFDNATVVRKQPSVNETKSDRWGFGLMFSKRMDTMLCTEYGYY